MQTPINSRDLALQNTDPRILGISTNYINLTCPTQQFKYGTDNVAQPASTIVTATLVGILQGTVTFTTTGLNPAPTAVGNTLTINPDNMTGDVVTINASLAAQGTTYQAVPLTLSKIYNQLVAKTTRAIDLLAAYTDGSGYTLPAANNYIELYNGVVKLTSGVVYGPATQTSNGLTATVNTSTGLITLSQTAANTWTGTSESFTFTATRGSIAYSTTYTITKAKAGTGGQQLAEIALYKWSTAQPSAPTAQSTYNWFTQSHTYAGTDWSTTVAAFDGTVGLKLWKITKAITAEALTSVQTYVFSWTSPVTIRQVTTEANELIKTAFPKVYKTALTIPTISGTSRYDWTAGTVVANLSTLGDPTPTAAPAGWSLTQPTVAPGFTLYQALVSIIDGQSASVTPIDWTTASITPISYAGSSGLSGITAVLTNDTHAIPTDSAGGNINFSNSGTDLFIYEGATALTYDGDGTTTGKFTVTAAVDGVTAGAATVVTVNSVTGVRYANLTAASFDKASTGSITFTITGRRLTIEPGQTLGTAFSYTVKQSFTKTPSGDPSISYWVTSSTSVIQRTTPVTGNPVFTPTTITFTNKKSVGSTTTDYTGYVKFYKNNTLQTLSNANISTYSYTVEQGTTSVKYELYSDSAFTNLLDSETVPVVADGPKGTTGTASITAVLTNDTHAIPTDSTDSTRNLTNSGTDLFIYEGATGLAYTTGTLSPGTFNVAVAATGVTAGAASTVTINSSGVVVTNGTPGGIIGVRYADLIAATFDKAGTGIIIFTVTGQRLDSTVFSYTVQQSFTKTPSGIQGDPGFAYWIVSSTSVIQKNSAGVFNPATITFTPKKSSSSTASNYTTGYSIIYRNDAEIARTDSNAYTYTIAAGTTSLRYDLYSDSGRTNLLDSETVPVVADGVSITGAPGISARRAYIVVPSAITPAATPATYEPTLAQGYPVSGTWFTTNSNNITWTVNWLATAPNSISEGYTLYQSDGLYNSVTEKTTWNPPYISSLKVGNLAAISINTGALKITDKLTGGQASTLTSGTGFYVDSSGYLRVGTPGGAQLKYDDTGLTISDSTGTNIFTVVGTAQSAASASASSASSSASSASSSASSASSSASSASSSASSASSSASSSSSSADSAAIAAAAAALAGSVTWLGDPSIQVVSGTRLKKIAYTGYSGNWDSKKYSAESFVNGAFVSFQVQTGYAFMMGLNSDPTTRSTNSDYITLDYAWYIDGGGGLYIYESGAYIGYYGSHNITSVYSVVYDGKAVKYYVDGVLQREKTTTADIRFYLDSSFATIGAEARSIRFGPVGPAGTAATIALGTISTGAAGTNVSVTNSGTSSAAVLNFTIPRGNKGDDSTVPGPTGPRGSVQGFGSKYSITNDAWSDYLGNRIIRNLVYGEAYTSSLYTTDLNRIGDLVTITNTAQTASFTRFWDGGSWADPQVIINGNLIATGTIAADKLAANSLLVGHRIANQAGTFVMNFGTSPYISISV